MINAQSLQAVESAQISPQFVRPLYDAYGFAQIPQTIRYCLAASEQRGIPFGPRDDLYQRYDTVILLLVDALGWRFFEQYGDSAPFLRRFAGDGLVCKLTSQFPSTTAAHITTIHTGLPVGQSGVYEWFYYEPQLDALIAPLLFSFARDSKRNTLARAGVPAEALYPSQTLYQDLGRHGVDSFIVQHQAYAFSPYTKVVTSGARIVPYRTLPEALVNLDQLLDRQRGKAYYFLYVDSVDALCHTYGPESPQVAAEIEVLLAALEIVLHNRLARRSGRALLLLTADHGQVAIDPATTIYLNQRFPQLLPYLKTGRDGRPLAPAGSCRDMFLHVGDERLDEAHAFLRQALDGRAEIYRVQELIVQGFFGPGNLSAEFLGRVGNLAILPYAGESVWWYEKDVFEQKFYGAHGGLTNAEMETLLLALPYG
ncbi:MAG TPA: alkaline phosphatase family protein [Roseiflexaceae bacterium]